MKLYLHNIETLSNSMQLYKCIHAYMHICMCVCVCKCLCVHVYIYLCMCVRLQNNMDNNSGALFCWQNTQGVWLCDLELECNKCNSEKL